MIDASNVQSETEIKNDAIKENNKLLEQNSNDYHYDSKITEDYHKQSTSKDALNTHSDTLHSDEIDRSNKYLKLLTKDGEPRKIRKFSEIITKDPLTDTFTLETDHIAFRDNEDYTKLMACLINLQVQRAQVYSFLFHI